MDSKKNNVIIIAGPTGVGKTDLSLAVAKEFDGEIISADSMQIYRGLDVGTAKITHDEMNGVPHHLIDVVDPTEKFSVFDFQQHSTKIIHEIVQRGKTPIVVGGTGLYVNTLLYEMDFNKADNDEEYRKELWKISEEKGEDFLYEMLLSVAPQTKIEKENTKRVIRALEIFRSTGTIEEFESMPQRKDINPILIVLNRDRAELYERINLRVDKMIQDGLLEEVKNLYDNGIDDKYQSMKAIGYYQIIQYFQGIFTQEESIEKIKQESRRYAKRQLTWFKRYKEALWFDTANSSEEEIINAIKQKISTNFA